MEGTGVFIPSNKVYNEQLDEHFEKLGLSAHSLMNHLNLQDSETFVDASYHHYVTYPECGMSKVPLKMVEPNEKRLEWNSFPMDFLSERWAETIRIVLKRNGLKPRNIDYYVFSHLSDAYNTETLKLLGISPDENRYHFVGTEYGYTGNTCPIVCLNRMWDLYSNPGKRIIICTVGAGYSIIVHLYQF